LIDFAIDFAEQGEGVIGGEGFISDISWDAPFDGIMPVNFTLTKAGRSEYTP
jgi:predicted secreted protein